MIPNVGLKDGLRRQLDATHFGKIRAHSTDKFKQMEKERMLDPIYPTILSGADWDPTYEKLKESISGGKADATYSIKVFYYNIQRGYQTNGNNISAKGLWESYIAAPNTDNVASESGSYVSRVDAACGVQYKAVTIQPLIYAIMTKNVAQHFNEMAREYGLNLTTMRLQVHTRSVIRAGHCTYWAARAQPAGEATVALGVQVRSSPIYQAVTCNNVEALEALLFNGPGRTVTGDVRYIKTCTEESPAEEASAGAHLMYDPNERSAQYLLKSVSISREDMLGFGGPEFEGTNQQKHSDFPTSGKEFGKTAEELFLKNSAGVPSWESLACEWTLDEKTVMLTPFELAFEKYLPAHMEALLWAPAVLATESLRLSSSANVIFPSRLAQMRNLTSLTVYVTSAVAAAVPSVIFELSALRRLVLAGCTYTEIPDEIARLTLLEELDVSSMLLASVPVITLGKLRRLTSVDCSGMKLISPPAEIVKQGPAAVAQYILALGDGAEKNHDVLLMLIGDGEAGKTSMLQALKDLDTHRAGTIGVDERTVGIDISSFQPDPQRPLRFFAWDFGGQGIYAIMQQLFVSRRALYPLLWRVRQSIDLSNIDASIKCDVCRKQLVARPGEKQEPAYRVKGQGLCHSRCVSYDELISSWTERLQFRVPGVSMVLIATHIDCATPEEVEEQCAAVERVVAKIQARQALTMEGIAPLRVYNNGRSLRINNMTGEGVAELRRKLCEIAGGLDFYGEVIPSSYVRLRQRLRVMQRHDEASWRTWLPYEEYARIAAECGLADTTTLQLATRFLHDVGELRYYALSSEVSESAAEGAEAAHDSDGEEADASSVPESGTSRAVTSSAELLAATVFPNPFWVVDVLRGLIRHDHSPVLALIKKEASLSTADKRTLRRRVYRLMQRGILHESLLRFVWAGVAGMSDSDAANADEFARLIALMKAFNILMDKPGAVKGREWIVPTLAAGKHARTMESDAFVDDSLPFVCRIVYDALPPYFDMILVAHIMNRRLANSVDFIEGAAAFQQLGERALLFAGLGKVKSPESVFRRDQICEEKMRRVLREDQCHVVVATSCRRLMVQLVNEVKNLESFFPGLRRLCALFPCYSCRMQRIADKNGEALPQGSAGEEDGMHPGSDSAPEDGPAALAAAEAEDVEQQAYLQLVQNADALNCSSVFVRNRAVLSKALEESPDLAQMIAIRDSGDLYIEFEDAGFIHSVYGEETPRFYKEVLIVLLKLLAAVSPPTDELAPFLADEFQNRISELQNAVAERQFQIAFQQAGAELPSLWTIRKFCAKHADALFAAWELCPDLEVLCMSFSAALEEKSNGAEGSSLMTLPSYAARLRREEAAPEYMHLLRSAVQVVDAQRRPMSASNRGRAEADEYRQLTEEREHDIAILSSAGSRWTTLSSMLEKAYGASTSEFRAEHRRALQEVLAVLDKALLVGSAGEAAALEEDRAAVLALKDYKHQRGADGSSAGSDASNGAPVWLGSDLGVQFEATAESLGGDGPASADSSRARVERLYFADQLETAVRAVYEAHIVRARALCTEADPRFDLSRYVTVREAFAAYIQLHDVYSFLIASLQPAVDDEPATEQWPDIFPPSMELCTITESRALAGVMAEAEWAQKLLVFMTYVRAIERTEQAQSLRQLDPSDLYISASDLEEYWLEREPLFAAILGQDNMTSTFSTPDEVAGIGFCFCSSDFWARAFFGVESSMEQQFRECAFNTASAAYSVLSRCLAIAKSKSPAVALCEAHLAKMAAWERGFPLGRVNRAVRSEELNAAIDVTPPRQLMALQLFYTHRKAMVDILRMAEKGLAAGEDWRFFDDMLRALLYLQDGKDPAVLLENIMIREEDNRVMKELLAQCVLPETTAAIDELLISADKMCTETAELKDEIRANILSDIWAIPRACLLELRDARAAAVAVVVAAHQRRAKTLRTVNFYKIQTIERIGADIDKILEGFVHRAEVWRKTRAEALSAEQNNAVLQDLSDLVKQTKAGILVYKNLGDYKAEAVGLRIASLTACTRARAEKYLTLMKLRNKYAPPWHFGGGKRTAVNRFQGGSSVKPEQLLSECWDDDWDDFVNDRPDPHFCFCPGEAVAGMDTSVTAQPATLSVCISHSHNAQMFAWELRGAIASGSLGLAAAAIGTDNGWSDKLERAKVLICLIDPAYGGQVLCMQQLVRAQELGMGVIPLVMPGYRVSNYQQWWPEEMPSLQHHSLFIDVRNFNPHGNDAEQLHKLCDTALGQTLRVLLSEYKSSTARAPVQAHHAPHGSIAPGASQDTAPVTSKALDGTPYITCEQCLIEGTSLESSDGSSGGQPAQAGRFDRSLCVQMVGEWTSQELRRREEFPDAPHVAVCPSTVCCSGRAAHEKLARDVLAVKEKKNSYPCPSCVSKGILPPFCFDREACLVERDHNKGGTVLCKRCHSYTPLHELLVCEVFLSYCWGAPACPRCSSIWAPKKLQRGHCAQCDKSWGGDTCAFDTQRLVSELKGAIEPEAGVMCWQDLDRLMGGKDLEREMEVGIKQADVVVIFLDDGYVRSHNCRREYLYSTKHGKYVVPVLLRGYTGMTGEQWWPDSMSSLSQFEPIVFTEQSQMEHVLFEICERIQSRFHRAQRFPTADDAIAYLRDYSSWGITRKAFLTENLLVQRREDVDAHLQAAFRKIDRDGNDLIDEAELAAFLDENKLCLTSEQIATLIRDADIDQNGFLNLEELKLAVFALLEEQEQKPGATD